MLRRLVGFCRLFYVFKPWHNQICEFTRYWKLYGGARALASSPYAQISIMLGLANWWFGSPSFDPAQITLSIIPSLLGFTIGALAIILAFSSSRIFIHLAENGKESSVFMKTVANFVHFITVQVLSLLIAIIYSASNLSALKVLSSVLLIYSILTALSVGIQLFQMSGVFNAGVGIGENTADDK